MTATGADALRAVNTSAVYDRLSSAGSSLSGERRFIGRCKRCGKTHKLEGEILMGHAPGRHEYVVRDRDGLLFTTAAHGSDTANVWGPCGDHRCLLKRVVEGSKRSKHECGARCTNATGPNCDCRCRGRNHGANC